MSNQGRQLRKKFREKDHEVATRDLEEVAFALHQSKVFADREAIRSVLNNPAGLDLNYYTTFFSWIRGCRYVISIRKAEGIKDIYRIMHYHEPEPLI